MTGFEIATLEDVGDERGSAWRRPAALDRLEGIADVHVMTLDPGHARGHHFHLEKRELIVVEHEASWLLLWDEGEGEPAQGRHFEGAGAVAAFAPPGCAHAIENDGPRPIRIVAFTERPFDPDHPDTHPRSLRPPGAAS